MDYKDGQIPVSVGCLVGGVQSFCGITTNAAKARLQGFEAEANAVLARDFAGAGSNVRFNGTVGFIDAKYKRFIGPDGTDVSDIRTFQNTPKWTAAGTIAAGIPAMGGMVAARSEERRVGNGWVRAGSTGGSPYH